MPTIKNRRATKAQWTLLNSVLAAGEFGLEIDTNKLKVGNGLSPWDQLQYFVDETVLAVLLASQVGPLVSEAISQDETIVEAASDAVTSTLAARDLVSGTDPRMTRFLNRAGIAIAETDENGNVSRLVDTAGHTWIKPAANIIDSAAIQDSAVSERSLSSAVSARMSTPMNDGTIVGGFTDGVRMSELVINEEGSVPQWAANRIVERGLSKGALSGALAGPDLLMAGDSLTWHGSSGGTAGWPGIVAANLGVNQYNAGWTGQTASDIAARMGALQVRVVLPNKTLPASGSVTVTITGSGNPVGGSILVGKTLDGVILTSRGPIPTTLQRPDTNTIQLTRTTPGDPIVFAADPVWHPLVQPPRSDRIHIFWVGRNGPTQPGNLAALEAMVAQQTAGRKRFLVLEVPPWKDSAEPFADSFNQILCEKFPNNYVPIATWLRTTEAATAAGIVFTADDLIDIADGYLPRSFRDDGVHPSSAARIAIAYYITREIESRGWV
jgi:lysophospholipase L1-like esterase